MRPALVVSVVFVVACSHPQPAPMPAPVVAQPDCAAAVEGAMRIVAPHLKTPADSGRAKGALALRCVEDKWTAEATACIAKVTEPDAAHKCLHDFATPAQRDAMFRAIAEVIDVPPQETPPPPTGAQAEIAERANADGVIALEAKQYAAASAKFRDAVARVPEPKYFFNLCVALFQEGKFGEALVACHGATVNNPPPAMAGKIAKLEDRIRAEAKAQGISVAP